MIRLRYISSYKNRVPRHKKRYKVPKALKVARGGKFDEAHPDDVSCTSRSTTTERRTTPTRENGCEGSDAPVLEKGHYTYLLLAHPFSIRLHSRPYVRSLAVDLTLI
jgi:hypothetical protein